MKFKTKKIALCLAILSSISMSKSIFAEDVEIYLGSTDTESSVNIMFMLDTSGSMDWDVPGTTDSRMDQAKSSLKSVIADLPGDMKVGLGRFNDPAGSILTPARRLDEVIELDIVKKPVNDEDDAYERDGRTEETFVYTDELYFEPSTASITSTISDEKNDTEECSNGSNTRLTARTAGIPRDGTRCREVNTFLFQDLNIPPNAEILSAIMVLTTETANYNVSAEVYLEKDADPDNFQYSNAMGRTYYSDHSTWSFTPEAHGSANYSPDLSSLVQQAVSSGSWDQENNGLSFLLYSNDYSFYSRNANTYYTASASTPSYYPLLKVSYKSSDAAKNLVGIRFSDFYAPSNSSVNKADLKLVASGNNGTGSVVFKVETNKESVAYEEIDDNISDRSISIAELEIPYTDWNAGEERIFDISSLIQSKVNDSSWCGGGDINVIATSTSADAIYAKDHSEQNAPSLSLRYSGGTAASCLSYDVITQIENYEDDSQEDPKNNKNKQLSRNVTIKGSGHGGFIFRDVNIPNDAKITEAYFQMTSSANESQSINFELFSVTPPAYPITAYDSSKKTITTTRGAWSSAKSWTIPDIDKNGVYNSPDLTSEIQAIVDSSSFQSASEKGFEFILKNNSSETVSITAYDNNPGNAAKLIIRYDGGSAASFSSLNISDSSALVADEDSSALTVRQYLIALVDEQPASGGTPMEGSLYEAGQYFMGNDVDYGRSRNSSQTNSSNRSSQRISGEDTYTDGTIVYPDGCTSDNLDDSDCNNISIDGSPKYITPMTDNVCETNNIILITDGYPTDYNPYSTSIKGYDGETLVKKIKDETTVSCTNSWTCATAWITYMHETDFMPEKSGKSNIYTHIVGFTELDSTGALKSLANAGGGVFVSSNNTEELTSDLNLVISSILEVESTLATPGIAVNQNNRTEHLADIYYSVFQPSLGKSWMGNLKKYSLDATTGNVVDKDGVNAVDSSTGFFAGGTTSYWSEEVDGGDVALGGAANKLSLVDRKVYTYTDLIPSELELNDSEQIVSKNNSLITKAMFELSDADISDLEFEKLVDWSGGVDIFDENLDGDYTDARKIMGDPLHSRPIMVSYSDTQNIVFVSTNEGYLHAIDSSTGEEKFAFIPQELLPQLYDMYLGGSGSKIYGLDSSWVAWRHDANKDGDINEADGDKLYLYSGMRRGGDSFYALDVTNINAPKLKFVKKPSTLNFEDLGQTWSEAVLGTIKHDGVDKVVAIFAGGYDSSYDSVDYKGLTEELGSQLYIIDAETGELLHKTTGTDGGGDLIIPGMNYSITSTPTILDLKGNGVIDSIYLTDLGGQIIKLSLLENEDKTETEITGKIIAKLGKSVGTDDIEDARSFYDSVAVAPIVDGDEKYIAIVAGSGYRAHPLDLQRKDYIFVLKDKEDFYTYVPELIESPIVIRDLADITNTLNEAAASNKISSKKGYYIALKESGNAYIGEKITGKPIIYNNQVFINSYVPRENSSECIPVLGYSRGYQFNLKSGTPDSDQDENSTIESSDRYVDKVTSGIANGSKIIYTKDGTFLLTNTKVSKITENGDVLGLNHKRWYIEEAE